MGIPGDIPNLQSPDFTPTKMDAYAGQVKKAGSPFAKDEIVSELSYLQRHDIKLEQKHLDNLLGGQPVLSTPGQVLANIDEITETINANPFLRANPLTTFTLAYLELAAEMMKMKLAEGEASADYITAMAASTQDLADLIKELGELEATSHFVAGAMGVASAVISTVGGIAGMAKSGNLGLSQGITTTTQGLSQLFQSADKFAQGFISLDKASKEATKAFVQNEIEAIRQGLEESGKAKDKAEEMISQTLQLLAQLAKSMKQQSTLQRGGAA